MMPLCRWCVYVSVCLCVYVQRRGLKSYAFRKWYMNSFYRDGPWSAAGAGAAPPKVRWRRVEPKTSQPGSSAAPPGRRAGSGGGASSEPGSGCTWFWPASAAPWRPSRRSCSPWRTSRRSRFPSRRWPRIRSWKCPPAEEFWMGGGGRGYAQEHVTTITWRPAKEGGEFVRRQEIKNVLNNFQICWPSLDQSCCTVVKFERWIQLIKLSTKKIFEEVTTTKHERRRKTIRKFQSIFQRTRISIEEKYGQ